MSLRDLMTDAERAREDRWTHEKRVALENYRKSQQARSMLDSMNVLQRRDSLAKMGRDARAEMMTLLTEEHAKRKQSA